MEDAGIRFFFKQSFVHNYNVNVDSANVAIRLLVPYIKGLKV